MSNLLKLEILQSTAGPAPQTRALLFLHGMWHNARCWERYFMPFFRQQGYSSYALSFRGHGNSKGALSTAGIDDYADDIGSALEETGHNPVFIAHSMAGYALQKYMQTHQVNDCVFIASLPPRGIRAAAARAAKLIPEATDTASGSIERMVNSPERFKLLFLSPETTPDTALDYYSSMAGRESDKAFADMLSPLKPAPAKRPRNVLVLGAENDVLVSAAETGTLARTYGVNPEIIPETAHDMMLDINWRKTAEKILNWLKTIQGETYDQNNARPPAR